MRFAAFLIISLAVVGIILGGQWVIDQVTGSGVGLIQCADGSTRPVSEGCPPVRSQPQTDQSAPVQPQAQPQDDDSVRAGPQPGAGDGATVGGGERRDRQHYGDPISFSVGESVYGETIYFDPPFDRLNCTGGHCFVERAPGPGQVYGGVVYPWHSEIRGKNLQVIPSA